MATRNIVTQTGIEDLKFSLSELASNLASHANASLSKAHGINTITGYVDSYGNDLTTYQDSAGAVLGAYFVVFTVSGVRYYAPANATALAGQAALTAGIDTSGNDAFSGQGTSALITDYTSDLITQATNVNNNVLIPHTRLAHWNAHGNITVAAQKTYSSTGTQVGSHLVYLTIGGVNYSIPVSDRIGGPVRTPVVSGISPSQSVHFGSGEPNSCNIPLTLTVTAGTRPIVYHWQFNSNGTWTDITPASSGALSVPGWNSGIGYAWASTSTSTFTITSANPGSDATASMQLRCRVTNDAIPDTGPTSGVITNICVFTAQDDTGGCFITTAVCTTLGLTDNCDELNTLRAFRDSYMTESAYRLTLLDEYDRIAPLIAAKMSPAVCAEVFERSIQPAVQAIRAGDYESAFGLYLTLVEDLKQRYVIA